MPKNGRRALLSLLVLIAACSGADRERVGDPDGTLGSSGSLMPSPADSAIGEPAAANPSEDPVAPVPMDTGPSVIERPAADAAPSPHPWVNGLSTGGTRASGSALLRSVRVARHDGFDRVVFEFDTHVPEWRVEYVDSPQFECGSGVAVRPAGDGWLQVNFTGANAHTAEGRPTAAPRRVADPAGTNLRELRRTCDFEAHVAYVLGMAAPNEYRAFQLSSPARLVVDVRQ